MFLSIAFIRRKLQQALLLIWTFWSLHTHPFARRQFHSTIEFDRVSDLFKDRSVKIG